MKASCPEKDIPECQGASGLGWAVAFDVRTPDGSPGTVVVVMDSDYQVKFTSGG